ncbi:MAG: class I SAM-dependent methyltransferase [Maribacter sp.]|nr:class I SAM-dependent methyltransferase [Maribacter sp.]
MKIEPKSNLNYSNIILEFESPTSVRNKTHYLVGFVFLVLNKIRHKLQGYKSARGFSSDLIEKALAHDLSIITRWRDYLKKYTETTNNDVFKGKKILELGPGADLGVGLLLLSEKAKSYSAIDVHNLVKATPPAFYEYLFKYLEKSDIDTNIEELRKQLDLTEGERNEGLNYHFRKDFDLSLFPDMHFDLVVSNAAFQQFDNPVKTISQLSKIAKSGAKFIALIDLKTHTRYLKTKDPLNIYRYNDFIFKPLRFKGSPNRMRPYEYENALKSHGWKDIKIYPRLQLNMDYLPKVSHTLNKKFRDDSNQMHYLTVVICATKL